MILKNLTVNDGMSYLVRVSLCSFFVLCRTINNSEFRLLLSPRLLLIEFRFQKTDLCFQLMYLLLQILLIYKLIRDSLERLFNFLFVGNCPTAFLGLVILDFFLLLCEDKHAKDFLEHY